MATDAKAEWCSVLQLLRLEVRYHRYSGFSGGVDHTPAPQAGFCQGTLKPALPVTTIRVVDLVNVFFNVSIRVIGTCTLLSGVGIFRFFEVTPRHSKGVES